jgi:hypothetical protein
MNLIIQNSKEKIIRMNYFTNVFIAYRIILTIPVSVASAKRSF